MSITPDLPRLGTILCPVDLSHHSQAGLYTAAGLSMAGARLYVLRVVRPAADEDETLGASQELRDFVQAVLPGWLTSAGGNTELIVRPGSVAPAILSAARDFGASLIVLGTRGQGPISRAMLGSVTADVLRHTTTPVAIIPPSHPEIVALAETHAVAQFDTILVPIDLESGSDRQLEMAVRLSAPSRHGIVVLHVVEPGTPHDVPLARMNALVSRFATTAEVQLQVKDGSPADIIGDLVGHGDIGIAVLGRSSVNPGRVALEASRRGKAVLILVP